MAKAISQKALEVNPFSDNNFFQLIHLPVYLQIHQRALYLAAVLHRILEYL